MTTITERWSLKGHASHAFTWRILSWMACRKCGLVCLRNESTTKAMAKPCGGDS